MNEGGSGGNARGQENRDGRNRTYLFTILCHLGSIPRPLLERGQTVVQLDLPQKTSKDAKATGRLGLRMRTGYPMGNKGEEGGAENYPRKWAT